MGTRTSTVWRTVYAPYQDLEYAPCKILDFKCNYLTHCILKPAAAGQEPELLLYGVLSMRLTRFWISNVTC